MKKTIQQEEGSTATPPLEITCPRTLTSSNQNSHLDSLANNFFSRKTPKTTLKCSACSSSDARSYVYVKTPGRTLEF